MLWTLVAREMRIQSRKRATYDLRLGWGLAAMAVVWIFVWHFPQHSGNGRNLLSVVHGCLAVMLFLLAPLGASDAISKEKREGTLGLLMLTPLTPRQVVVGKVAAHFLRLFYFSLMMLPFLILPVLLGGVEFQDFLLSAIILFSIAAAGLSAGLVASALLVNFGAALFWAMFLGAVFTLLIGSSIANGMLSLSPNRNLGEIPGVIRIFVLGPLMMMFPAQVRDFAGMFFPFRWNIPLLQCLLALFSVLCVAASIRFSARKVAQQNSFAGETKRQAAFREKFLTPRFWKGAFRESMRRKLDRNPLIWLEYRNTWARTARWAMIMLALAGETFLLTSLPNKSDFFEFHLMALMLFVAFLTFKSSSSFQNEKETGAFELLLVTPLTETKLLVARLAAVANYYLPTVVILASLGWFGFSWASWTTHSLSPGLLSPVVNFTSLCMSVLTVPICGLYFALRCKTFLPALLWTAGVAVVGPICAWLAVNGMLWMAATQNSPSPLVLLHNTLQMIWWPALVAIILYHLLVGALCLRGTVELLRRREFAA